MSHFDCQFLIASNASGLFKFATYQSRSNENPQNLKENELKIHMKKKHSLPFFQRVFGKHREIRKASMKDCVSDPSRNFGTQHISQTREKSGDTTAPSPTLSKGSTHDHSTPRLQFPSLEFSSCTPWDEQLLRHEGLD